MIKERLISAVIGTLFIAIFQPFGIIHFGWWRWPLLIGIGILMLLMIVANLNDVLRWIGIM